MTTRKIRRVAAWCVLGVASAPIVFMVIDKPIILALVAAVTAAGTALYWAIGEVIRDK